MANQDPKTPRASFDKQGEAPDAARVEAAMAGFMVEFGRDAAAYMNTCVRCGECAEACHFYQTTGDPKYTPIHKIKPFEDAYHRTHGPFSSLARMLHLAPKLTIDALQDWEELIFDSCTLCGRCTMACPMGIDIAGLVKQTRHGMFEAGLLPERLAQIARNAETKHSPFGTPEDFLQVVAEIDAEFDIKLPVDKPKADLLYTVAPGDLEEDHASIAGAAKILDRLGIDWTLSSQAFEATNFGYLSGNTQLQAELTCRLIDKAYEIGAKTILLPECGHAWGALRWEAARWYGGPVTGLEVMHIVEFIAKHVQDGSLKISPAPGTTTFHDPCQLVRRGGLEWAPRVILKALGRELHELADHGTESYCCGGGGGVLANARAEPLRIKAFELKRDQVEATKAAHFVTSCGQCRLQFNKGKKATGWDREVESLLELVAANLATEMPQDSNVR